MTQLLLDLQPAPPPTFDNFIVGDNPELLTRLRAVAEPGCFDMLYVWGSAGSGKTHLLSAVAARALRRRPVMFLDAQPQPSNGSAPDRPAAVDFCAPPGGLLIVDDVDRFDDTAQIALFRLYNTARLIGLGLLIAGPCPPLQLRLREDLRTRIGQTLIYEVKPLDDTAKADVLRRHAAARGLRLDETLLNYLLAHGRRDLPTLMAVLEHLDRLTLQRQRPATLPLLREILQRHLPLD